MKKLIFFILILCTAAAQGQLLNGKFYQPIKAPYSWESGWFKTNLNIPKDSATTGRDTGAVYYRLSDSSLYIWSGTTWRRANVYTAGDGLTLIGSQFKLGGAYSNDIAVTSTNGKLFRINSSKTTPVENDAYLEIAPNYFQSFNRSKFNPSKWHSTFIDAFTSDSAQGSYIKHIVINESGESSLHLHDSTVELHTGNFYGSNSFGIKPDSGFSYKRISYNSNYGSSFTKHSLVDKNFVDSSLLLKLNKTDTTAKWVTKIYRKTASDSVFYIVGGIHIFSHKDSIGVGGGGITTLNTLTGATQTFATGTTGTDFNISSATTIHSFNLPTASATNRGALSTTDWTTFNNKIGFHLINGATNLGSGAQIFVDTLANKLRFRSLTEGFGINQTENADDVLTMVDSAEVATKARLKHVTDSLAYLISGESQSWGTYAQRVALTGMVAGQRFYQTNERSGAWEYGTNGWIHRPHNVLTDFMGSANGITGATTGTGAAVGRSVYGHLDYGVFYRVATGTTSTGAAIMYSPVNATGIAVSLIADTSSTGKKYVYTTRAALTRAPTNGDDFRAVIGVRSLGATSYDDSSAAGYGHYFRISYYRDNLYIQCHSQSRNTTIYQTTTTSVLYSGMVLSTLYSTDPYWQGNSYEFTIVYGPKRAEFYINGTLVATHYMPTAHEASWIVEADFQNTIQKVSGTTNSQLHIYNQYIYRQ